ncbi:hypothetical protein PSHT_11905 [Puccinia striiformis]|uniref:Uncharacterized protein n=1 Tax=Puccinia striiformis TaxID=27350 RepID=A0A2S4V027_9BASI|nr:hypothetical protein PSHT_11905 [Puccinia striiformis]
MRARMLAIGRQQPYSTWAYMTASNLPPWAPVTRRCPVRVKHGSPI